MAHLWPALPASHDAGSCPLEPLLASWSPSGSGCPRSSKSHGNWDSEELRDPAAIKRQRQAWNPLQPDSRAQLQHVSSYGLAVSLLAPAQQPKCLSVGTWLPRTEGLRHLEVTPRFGAGDSGLGPHALMRHKHKDQLQPCLGRRGGAPAQAGLGTVETKRRKPPGCFYEALRRKRKRHESQA